MSWWSSLSTEEKGLLGGLVVAGGAAVLWKTGLARDAVNMAVDLATRGQRLTQSYTNVDGNIPDEPAALVAAAAAVLGRNVDPDDYSVARMVRSEEGGESTDVRELLAHVAWNDAQALGGWSLTRLMTYSTVADNNGLYGAQSGHRRYSTAVDPYEQDLGVAEAVRASRLAGELDPTGGATKFFNRGRTLSADPPASWANEGYVAVNIDPAPERLLFFRRG